MIDPPGTDPADLRPPDPERYARRVAPLLRLGIAYHRFEVRGLDRIPRGGASLLVGTHSTITYDSLLATHLVGEHIGRVPRTLGASIWFRRPWMAQWFRDLGTVNTTRGVAEALLADGQMVAVAPGGVREAMRPSSARETPDWEGRYGFVRLWLASRVPLLLGTCPAAERALTVYANPLTRLAYDRFRFPLPILRGLGLSPIPRPVKLTYYLSHPIEAPAQVPADGPLTEARVREVHADLTRRMRAFVEEARRADAGDPSAG